MIRALIVIAAVALSSSAALAAEWPSKAVRVVVPFAAGGAADTIGRLYTDALTAAFGKQFYIENRVGGGGLVGTEAVARAEPDGFTLMVSGIPTHVLGPAMNKNVGFDPMRGFTHIAYFGGTPNVILEFINHKQKQARRTFGRTRGRLQSCADHVLIRRDYDFAGLMGR
jgi:tripartite-type tricarboxylate transporter receptor subunit TctC